MPSLTDAQTDRMNAFLARLFDGAARTVRHEAGAGGASLGMLYETWGIPSVRVEIKRVNEERWRMRDMSGETVSYENVEAALQDLILTRARQESPALLLSQADSQDAAVRWKEEIETWATTKEWLDRYGKFKAERAPTAKERQQIEESRRAGAISAAAAQHGQTPAAMMLAGE